MRAPLRITFHGQLYVVSPKLVRQGQNLVRGDATHIGTIGSRRAAFRVEAAITADINRVVLALTLVKGPSTQHA